MDNDRKQCNCHYCDARQQELNICDRCGFISPGKRALDDGIISLCKECDLKLAIEAQVNKTR